MKNKIIKVKVPFNFHWTCGVTLEQFKKDLDELEKLGVTEISIEAEEIWGKMLIKNN